MFKSHVETPGADQSISILWWSDPAPNNMYVCSLDRHTECQKHSIISEVCRQLHVLSKFIVAEKLVNLCVSWVQSFNVYVSLWVNWMWARGLQGENQWAHLSEMQRFKSFHSSVLQFYLWKTTRNVVSCPPHLAESTSETHTLIHLICPFFYILLGSSSCYYPHPTGLATHLAALNHWIEFNYITQRASLLPIACMC